MGETVVYADFEHSLRSQYQYIKNMGIDPSPPKFIHLVPTNLQDGCKTIGEAITKLKPALVIIDSVTTMLPKETFEKEADEGSALGLQARLVGSFLNWVAKKIGKTNTALVLLNQLRNAIKGQYDPGPREVTSGGRAVPFYCTVRLHLRGTDEKEEITEKNLVTGLSEKKRVSQAVKVVVKKNKFDMPYKSGPIYIEFGQGIDNVMSLLVLGINKGIIKKGGAGYFTWKDPNGDTSFNVQGKTALKKYLETHPGVLEKLQPYLVPTTDTKEMDQTQADLEARLEDLTVEEKERLIQIRKLKGEKTDDIEFDPEDMKDFEALNNAMS
jgi:RecA/RadA recombinase